MSRVTAEDKTSLTKCKRIENVEIMPKIPELDTKVSSPHFTDQSHAESADRNKTSAKECRMNFAHSKDEKPKSFAEAIKASTKPLTHLIKTTGKRQRKKD